MLSVLDFGFLISDLLCKSDYWIVDLNSGHMDSSVKKEKNLEFLKLRLCWGGFITPLFPPEERSFTIFVFAAVSLRGGYQVNQPHWAVLVPQPA